MSKTLKDRILEHFEPIKADIEALMLYSDAFKQAHLLLVLKDHASIASLESLKNKVLFKKKLVDIKIFFYQELVNALDVFPIEFIQIQEKHALLIGRDVFDGLIVSKENLRHQCEFYLRSNLLSLRELKLKAVMPLNKVMMESLNQFLNVLDVCHPLFDITLKDHSSIDAILEAVGDVFQLDVSSLVHWIKEPQSIKSSDFSHYESLLSQFITCIDAL